VTEIYAAREELPPDLSGKVVVDAAAEVRPGMPIGWAPDPTNGASIVAAWAEAGDVVLVVGAGDIDRAVPLVLEALR
jgi:UDP-N-acetylmuramate--alanine ligase